MELKEREELESAQIEAEAHLNVLIEMMLSDAQPSGDDVATVLMRVRTLLRSICEASVDDTKQMTV